MLSAKANLDSLTSQKLYEGKPAYVAERAQRAEQRRNSMLLLENQRADMTIRAPRDGVITFRNAEAGSYAQAGSHLFTIVDNSSLHRSPVKDRRICFGSRRIAGEKVSGKNHLCKPGQKQRNQKLPGSRRIRQSRRPAEVRHVREGLPALSAKR